MTDLPSIHALRARLAKGIAECPLSPGCVACDDASDTIRVLDAVVPMLEDQLQGWTEERDMLRYHDISDTSHVDARIDNLRALLRDGEGAGG